MTSDRWINVHTVESIFEMDLLKAALDRESIEYVIKEHKDTAYDGLFILQKGYASVLVREKDEARVLTIVTRIKNIPHAGP
ncbi:MAG: DUF2007 domain-containing protein [Syntrophorhabdales bacterium]|jgi:hypothetical protein